MVETVICVVIVAGMMVAALEMLGTSARLRGLQTDQSRAAALARDLLSEIMQYNYQDPTLPTVVLGPEVGETRAGFDDVDDYNGLNESPPQTANGAAIAGYTGWTRSVQVSWADSANPSVNSLIETGLKRITITVTTSTGRKFVVSALRSNCGLYEKSYTSQSTYPCMAQISLQIGTDSSKKVTTSVNLVNQVP